MYFLRIKGPQSKKVLIKNVELEPISLEEFMVGLNTRPDPNIEGQFLVTGLAPNLSSSNECSVNMETVASNLSVVNKNGLQNLCNMGIAPKKIVLLDANRRLIIASTAGSTPTDQAPQTPLQELFVKKDLEPILASAFKNAFDMEIKLDYSSISLNLISSFANPFVGSYTALIKHSGKFSTANEPIIDIHIT